MKNIKYDKQFSDECGKILYELYYHPMDKGINGEKRQLVNSEKKYINYLEDLKLIKNLNSGTGNNYGIQLESEGSKVFDKYGGWINYQSQVIDQDLKLKNAKDLSIKYWWVPILISFAALVISIFTFFCKLYKIDI